MIQQRLQELKNILNFQLKQTIKNVNSEFSKAPIDTGLMLDTIDLVGITIDVENVTYTLNIKAQEYLKFVENGWGSNRNYGERKVRENAINHPDVVAAQKNLLQAIIVELMSRDTRGVRNVKIDI
jgi:hypothetical protein